MVVSALTLVVQGVVYVRRRIREQRTEGKTWSETMSDGHKPTTGSVWWDGVVLAALFVGAVGASLYFAPR
jgi:hypothetical protein